tara:strand:+ start:842 stop:1753 length:912 start_codon:yes stop_codon:yes gene_type:complete
MDLQSKIILLSGPTASGKSNFAVNLAKKIKGEIVNVDSMQVYKELKILTARPNIKEQKKIKHHLYGFISVKNKFSTGQWLKLASKKIVQIRKKKKIPILVGGTGLYFKALTEGLVKIPNISNKFRDEIRSLQKKIGQKKFYKKLIKIDPLIKNQINENDVQRSLRAYEIKKYTSKSMTVWFQKTKALFDEKVFIKIYIEFPRDELVKRINARVDRMFKEGAIQEVKKFKKIKIKRENSANKVIGIEEIKKYLDNKITLEQAKEQIAIKSRQYAKRQSTWARGQMMSWERIEPRNLNSALKKFN